MQDFLLDGKACSDNTAFENVLSYYLSAIILSRLTIAIMPPNYGSRATRVILKRGPEIIKDFMSGANKGLFLCRSSPLRIMSEASNPHTTGG
jgi:hypothetical protein